MGQAFTRTSVNDVPIFIIELATLARVATDTDYSLILGSGFSAAQTTSRNFTKK